MLPFKVLHFGIEIAQNKSGNYDCRLAERELGDLDAMRRNSIYVDDRHHPLEKLPRTPDHLDHAVI
jgi:hypothetical protein